MHIQPCILGIWGWCSQTSDSCTSSFWDTFRRRPSHLSPGRNVLPPPKKKWAFLAVRRSSPPCKWVRIFLMLLWPQDKMSSHIDENWFFFYPVWTLFLPKQGTMPLCLVRGGWNVLVVPESTEVLESPPAGKTHILGPAAALVAFTWATHIRQ